MAPLSNKQGYELARIGTKRGLPVDLQRLIWADDARRVSPVPPPSQKAPLALFCLEPYPDGLRCLPPSFPPS